MYEDITAQARTVVTELLDQANMKPGALFVVGCSSSEMVGKRIGKGSSLDAAQAAFQGIYPVLQERGIHLAVQCCEHLNRALIMERAVAEQKGYEIVNVMPQPHAGGSFAVTAWNAFEDPVAVEAIVLCARTRPKYIGAPVLCIRTDYLMQKKKSRKIVLAVVPASNLATFFCCRLCCFPASG